MTQQLYTIKEAAKELGVEAHALRYWEEELDLKIDRNTQGRRVYTEEDMQRFKAVMAWKDQGLQLKNIRELIHGEQQTASRIIVYRPKGMTDTLSPSHDEQEHYIENLEKAEKAKRLQELLKQFISESIRESNAELLEIMRDGLLKELDYQFRLQEEREEEREKVRIEKEDEHFRHLDENLRSAMEKGKKRKHFIF